jgi:hypothetical protein
MSAISDPPTGHSGALDLILGQLLGRYCRPDLPNTALPAPPYTAWIGAARVCQAPSGSPSLNSYAFTISSSGTGLLSFLQTFA